LPAPPGVDRCSSLLAYEGAGRELIARLKYRNARSTIRWLAARMSELVDSADVDVVTWVPTTADRRRQRGFDQAELLARAVARRLHRPCRRLILRRPGPPQTGRTLTERRAGPDFAVPALGRQPRVLLVDDVITTGSTLVVAATALRAAGAGGVIVVSASRTPLKRTPAHSDTFEE